MSMMVNPYRFGPGTPADDFLTSPTLKAEFNVPTDESGHQTFEVYNFPRRDTTSEKFGSYCYKPSAVSTGCFKCASNIDLGSGNFTVELWLGAAAEPATSTILGRWASSGNRSWKLEYNATTNQFIASVSTDGAASITANFDLDTTGSLNPAAFWNGAMRHVAMVNNGGTMTVYVEGVAGATTGSIGAAIYNGGSNSTYIGAHGSTSGSNPTSPIAAYLDEVRITVGVARYTAGFTPPSTQFGRNSTDDADWASVVLLLGMEAMFAADIGGSVTNEVLSNGTVSNTHFNSAGLRSVSTQIPHVAYDAGFDFGSGDFTLEVFGLQKVGAAFSSDSASSGILGCWSATAGDACWQIWLNASKEFAFRWSADGSTTTGNVTTGTVGAADTEYNIAVVRSGSSLYLYLNGTRVYSGAISGSLQAAGTNSVGLGIFGGWTSGGSNSNVMAGGAHMRAFRITKGTARYHGASYTVPSLPLP